MRCRFCNAPHAIQRNVMMVRGGGARIETRYLEPVFLCGSCAVEWSRPIGMLLTDFEDSHIARFTRCGECGVELEETTATCAECRPRAEARR